MERKRVTSILTLPFLLVCIAFSEADGSALRARTTAAIAATSDSALTACAMIAGELWDSFLPPNVGPYYGEHGLPLRATFLRIGNFERTWSTPTHMWPGGWPYGMFWAKGMYLVEFDPDSIWNPPAIGGATNLSHDPRAGGRYAFAAFSPSVVGAGDPARNYARGTRWVDPTTRHHAIYEAGWPTTIGVDVKLKIHQFTLNWNNFNDFIVVEITLTNTGVLDLNGDGIPDSLQTGRSGRNKIEALTMMAHGEVFGSYYLSPAGARASRLGSARGIGYVGDPDPHGAPWDMVVAFAGESSSGARDMGLNSYPERFYTDVWSAWSWIAVKQGAADSKQLSRLQDKRTLYDTHPLGTGVQRGWYATAGHGRGLEQNGLGSRGILSNPRIIHTAAMGTWYHDGGRSRDSAKLNLAPDPNFFSAGTPGDPTSFVPKPNPSRPDGDRKLLSATAGVYAFEVEPYEPSWKMGFSAANNFDGDLFSGIGPFSLEIGETITIVWAEAGGYRLHGVQNAIAAARWAFENGYSLPQAPAAPAMRLENTFVKSVKIRWDDRAESHPDFAGYKIWKISAAKPVAWLEGGMRGLDDYWRGTEPGQTSSELLKPVNPSFSPSPPTDDRLGIAGSWGPYELAAVIPAPALDQYRDATVPGYRYSFEDNAVLLGFRYWYYVSAVTQGAYDLGLSYAGLNDRTAVSIESSNLNRNGASGLWEGTYPFAELHSAFPTTSEGRRAIGAGFTIGSLPPSHAQLARGTARIGVKPNPYKKYAFWDNRQSPYDHSVMFYNLPEKATITILDVSGQIIHQFRHQAADPQNSTLTWNLFSKNGIEVASGLYAYIVEYEGGQVVGYLSILR